MAPSSSRKRRAPVAEESDSDDTPRQASNRRRRAGSDDDEGPDTTGVADDDTGGVTHDQLVKKLVRYALACEYQRTTIRRDAIREKVFARQKQPFNKIFQAAQEQLRDVFGMEMTELPGRDKSSLKDRLAQRDTKSAGHAPQSYILTSTLPSKYRVPAILPPSRIPDPSDEAAYVGLYSMIYALIVLNGGKLGDGKMQRYLQRLNANVNTPLDKIDVVLARMIKQGYIEKRKENSGNEETTEWIAAPRGKIEIGNLGVEGLVLEAYGNSADETLPDKIAASLGYARKPQVADDEEIAEVGNREETR